MNQLMEETSTQKLYWDDENHIVLGELAPTPHTLDHAMENVDAQERIRDTLKRGKTRVLIDMRNVKSISREARMYYANERTASIQRATALVVGSQITIMIANFFMGLNKPLSPTKMFSAPEPAIAWLKKFEDG